ncbi:MAG: DUF4858 domain-containing protein [Tannerellaceae bacterium]|jgi:hypothetical protein|nr:DUF4858 domain-containing protein [Tannerellaceae bacterium]
MGKRILLLVVFCTQYAESVYSQWTREDSVWLQDVLSGKKELRLNKDVLKAIESGTLINTDGGNSLLNYEPNPSSLNSLISKDFSEYLMPLENGKAINSFNIPPSVFMLMDLNVPGPKYKINEAAFNIPQSAKKGPVRTTFGVSLSFDDALKYIFMPSERAKIRNRKNANAWKSY